MYAKLKDHCAILGGEVILERGSQVEILDQVKRKEFGYPRISDLQAVRIPNTGLVVFVPEEALDTVKTES